MESPSTSSDEVLRSNSDLELPSPKKLNFNQFPHLHHIAVPIPTEKNLKDAKSHWGMQGFYPSYKGEPKWAIMQRQKAFNEVWEHVHGKIQETVNGVNSSLYDQVEEFVKNRPPECPEHKIPTGLLLDGSGGGAKDVWIQQLTERLLDITPIVVTLKMQHCRSYESVLLHLTSGVYNAWADFIAEDATGRMEGWSDIPQLKHYTKNHLRAFQEWYKKSHKLLKRKTGKEVRLVVLLESLGHVPTQVLYRLVKLLSILDKGNTRTRDKKRYQPALSVTFLVATVDVLDVGTQFLPSHIIEMLHTKEFRSSSRVALIDSILKELLFAISCPVVIGPPLLSSLVDWTSNSVLAFERDLKVALLMHFSKPGSQICLSSLPRLDCREYSHWRGQYKSIPRNAKLSKQQILKWKGEFENFREVFYRHFEKFFTWIQVSTDKGRRISRTQLWCDLLTKSATEIEYLEDVWSTLKSESPSAILQIISQFGLRFKDENQNIIEESEEAYKYIRSIIADKRANEQRRRKVSSSKSAARGLDALARLTQKQDRDTKTKAEKRRRNLGAGGHGRVIHDRYMKKIRETTVNYFRDFVDKYLPSLTAYPLHELLMCTDVRCVRESRHSSHKAQLCQQLSSRTYRGIDTLGASDLYEQLREPNRVINVHDLCRSLTLGQPDEAVATFFENLGAFNHIGLTSKSKRRTDHIQREMWP